MGTKKQKNMLICAVVYGLEKIKLYALRCMLYAMKTWERIAYGIKLNAFNPHNPRLNDSIGQAMNPPKSWFKQGIALQKHRHSRKGVKLLYQARGMNNEQGTRNFKL